MESINLGKLTKRYIIISIAAILVVLFGIFVFSNSFYIITSDKSFTVKSMKLEGDKNISKLISLYIIPRDTSSLRIESSNGANVPGDEIIKPLTGSDTRIGFHALKIEFSPQYEVQTNSRETEGCTYGKYPNIVSYRCSDPSRIVAYNSENPLDVGKAVYLPPTTINAITSNIVATADRTLGAAPYRDGLLTLNALQVTQHDLPLLGEMSLKYIDDQGNITDIALKGEYADFENGRYQLLTDSSGSSNFAIIDNQLFQIYTYKSTDDEPKVITLESEPDISLSNICDINNGKMACYSGVASTHVHGDEEHDHIQSMQDGDLVVYDLETGDIKDSSRVFKDHPLTNVCIDKSGKVYTLTNESIDLVGMKGKVITNYPVAHNATSISCGNNVHFTLDNKIYTIKDDGTAHLMYDSKLLPMVGVWSHGESVFMIGHYESLPQGMFSFSVLKPDAPHTKPRVSDVVASVVDKHKEEMNFEARFTPNSIDYIVSKQFTPNGTVEDTKAIKALRESTDKFKLGFQPKIHSVPNY